MIELKAVWQGPYSWPNYEQKNNLPSLPEQSGLYLQTVIYNDGYLIYAAGLTRRVVKQRFREHTRKYMSGDYNVLDVTEMQKGIRQEVWHGWGWTPAKRDNFEEQKSAILTAVERQLAGFRIFVASIGNEPRLLERLEAAIMNNLYRQPSPICDIPDKGMMLAPCWATETTITVTNECGFLLHGLPHQLEI